MRGRIRQVGTKASPSRDLFVSPPAGGSAGRQAGEGGYEQCATKPGTRKSELISRTSDNPHRPRLAKLTEPTPPRDVRPSAKQHPTLPPGPHPNPPRPCRGRDKNGTSTLGAPFERAPKAQSEPRRALLGRPSCRPLGSERHARSDPEKSIAERRYKNEEPHPQQRDSS